MRLHAYQIVLLAAALTLGATLPIEPQATPIGEPFSICPSVIQSGETSCGSPQVAALATGRFVVGTGEFTHFFSDEDTEHFSFGCGIGLFDSSGHRVGAHGLEGRSLESRWDPGPPAVAADGFGGLVASWGSSADPFRFILAQRFLGPDAVPEQEDELWVVGPDESDEFCGRQADVATNTAGQFAIAWAERPCSGTDSWIVARAYGTSRRPATRYLRIDPLPFAAFPLSPRIAMDGLGRFVVLWQAAASPNRAPSLLYGQRFGRDGRRLGPPFPIGGEASHSASLAMLQDGSFAVGWNEDRPDGTHSFLGWFTPEGDPAGPPTEVAQKEELKNLGLDRHGNAAVLSLAGTYGDWTARVRLINRALVAQGAAIDLVQHLIFPEGGIAMLSSGRTLAAWRGDNEEPRPDTSIYPNLGRILQANHDADACTFRGDGFACDTAGDGGEAEETIAFRPGPSGAQPLLADWDGDGRADPCVYQGGRFACDTAHDGGVAESETQAIGRAGDRPLLGDLDGDGKADPCVRRGVSFLCDRARDGGAKDLRIDFGLAGDFPLLGDPDGDGRDDPCVYRTGRFLCDTAHDGGTAELVLDLRRPVPGRPAGTPLFGDLDGDGRDEACFATKNERTCGFFHPTGGQPLRVERLAFGQAGDVPLMGDVDAF